MRDTLFDFVKDPERSLTERVQRILRKKYPSLPEKDLRLKELLEGSEIRKHEQSWIDSRLKKRRGKIAAEDVGRRKFCEQYDQYLRVQRDLPIQHVADAEEWQPIVASRLDMLMELTHDGALRKQLRDARAWLNEVTFLKNAERSTGYVSLERRVELKMEDQEPFEVRESRLLAECHKAFDVRSQSCQAMGECLVLEV